ncbi:hypothetical protein ACFL6Y_05700 [Elusimicrobiota bacterium]
MSEEKSNQEDIRGPLPTVEVKNLNVVNNPEKPWLKAVADIHAGHFRINGIRLVVSKDDVLFVSFPDKRVIVNGITDYVRVVRPLSGEIRVAMRSALFAEYQRKAKSKEQADENLTYGVPAKVSGGLKKVKEKAVLAAAVILTVSSQLFAATAEETTLTTAALGVLGPLARIGGIATLGYGLFWGLWSYSKGKDEQMESAKCAVMAGVGMLLVVTIANLITKSTGVGTLLR